MNVKKFSETEFTEYGLPHNRKEVFFDCLKMRYGLIVACGALILLFLLPLFAVAIFGETSFSVFYERNSADPTAIEDGANILKFYVSVASIPCLVIAALGFAGVYKIIRRLIWAEPVFFWRDFADGFKANGLQFGIAFAVFGAIIALDRLILVMNLPNPVFGFLPTAVTFVAILPVFMTMLSHSAVYNVRFFTLVKNSLLLFIKNVPINLLFVLIFAAFAALDLLTVTLLKYSLFVLITLFLSAPFVMARLLYDCSVFDRLINVRDYPEMVDKGLIRLEKIKDK